MNVCNLEWFSNDFGQLIGMFFLIPSQELSDGFGMVWDAPVDFAPKMRMEMLNWGKH